MGSDKPKAPDRPRTNPSSELLWWEKAILAGCFRLHRRAWERQHGPVSYEGIDRGVSTEKLAGAPKLGPFTRKDVERILKGALE